MYWIGDIHGQAKMLERLLGEIPDNEEIGFIGDIVDGGRFPVECIDLANARSSCCIPGNHDLDFLVILNSLNSEKNNFLEVAQKVGFIGKKGQDTSIFPASNVSDYFTHNSDEEYIYWIVKYFEVWKNNDGPLTNWDIETYCDDNQRSLKDVYDKFSRLVNQRPAFSAHDTYIAVHAGLPEDFLIEEKATHDIPHMVHTRDFQKTINTGKRLNKKVVIGHHPQPEPCIIQDTLIMIDTGAKWENALSAINMDEYTYISIKSDGSVKRGELKALDKPIDHGWIQQQPLSALQALQRQGALML